MDVYQLLIFQLIAHILADFIFQSPKVAESKNENGFKSKYLYLHAFIVFLTSFILSFQWLFVIASISIALSHFLLDGFKQHILQSKSMRSVWFFVDQILHLLIITAVVFLFNHYFYLKPIITHGLSNHQLLIMLAYLLVLKPTNVVIKEIFNLYHISISIKDNEELLNAGKLIGNIERVLTLTLVLLNQYEIVGFIFAAKSILRFKDSDTSRTEYVLIGTLLSFGIAILLGIGISLIK